VSRERYNPFRRGVCILEFVLILNEVSMID